MHRAIRSSNPDIAVIWSGAKSADLSGLYSVQPERFADDNIFWTFHYYAPHPFTHQGVQTSQSNMLHYRYLSDIPYPANLGNAHLLQEILEHNLLIDQSLDAAGRARFQNKAMNVINAYMRTDFGPKNIRQDFDKVSEWANQNKIPAERIFLGEFGVARRAQGGNGPATRHRNIWLREVRLAAEVHGFGWAIWDINQPQMGIVHKRNTPDFDKGILAALGLTNPNSGTAG